MSGPELRTRLRQEFAKRVDAGRDWLRLPASRPKLLPSGPAAPFFFERRDIDTIVSEIRRRIPEQVQQLTRRAELAAEKRFDLLGYRGLDFGHEINWQLDPVSSKQAPAARWPSVPYLDYARVGDHKVAWELGRHQHLSTLLRAWRITGDDRLRGAAIDQVRHFRENNRYPKGIHWTSALEVAFRALSWVWMERLLDADDPEREALLSDIGLSARYLERFLSTYFSPNTHLLGEALALYVIGLCCPRFDQAARWRELGREIVIQESERQLRADGLHFEQSFYYHVYTLDFYIHFKILNQRASTPLPDEVERRIEGAAEALRQAGQAGAAPRFGDDDGGRLFDGARCRREQMLDPLAPAAALFGRGDFKAATELTEEACWLLGPRGLADYDRLQDSPAPPESVGLAESGVYVMMSAEASPRALVVDAGPLGGLKGGHGHADLLSCEWIHDGRPLLIDPGTGQYPAESAWRDVFRGTAAHNTLTIDDEDQADAAGSFAWTSLPSATAERFTNGRLLDLLIATHPGYERLTPPAIHRRTVVQFKDGLLFVRDQALGTGQRLLDVHWRPAPDLRIAELTPDQVRFAAEDGRVLSFIAPRSAEWTREVYDAGASPAYGEIIAAQGLRYSANIELPAESGVFLSTRSAAAESTGRPASGAAPAHYVLEHQGDRTALWLADRPGVWNLDGWKTDARVLTWRSTADGSSEVFAAGASRLEWRGEAFMEPGDEELERFECRRRGDQIDAWSSDMQRIRKKALRTALGKLRIQS